MAVEIIEKELSYQIVQAAYEVFNALGPGFLESLYEEAMSVELRLQGHMVDRQKSVKIFSKKSKLVFMFWIWL